jgi:putative PIN family toxin of toxin-antitoxin system
MINEARLRVVFDCNVYFQALISPEGPAGRCLEAAIQGRVELVTSREVMAEFFQLAMRPRVIAKFRYSVDRVVLMMENVDRVAKEVDGAPRHFVLERDPSDAVYINLALHAGAGFVVSRDHDLLDLCDSSKSGGNEFMSAFPNLRVIPPDVLLSLLGE